MKHKLLLRVISISCLALFLPMTQVSSTAMAMPECDPVYVSIDGMLITVLPTGIDDTANLQCAFDAALAAGPGGTVRLVSGTYHTAQVVVYDFEGQFIGAGEKYTLIENLPNMYVTPVDMYLELPSADNPWPGLFTFFNGNISINDMAVYIVGDEPTTHWSIFGIDPPVHDLAYVVAFLGHEVHARVDHVFFQGEIDPVSVFGYNLVNGIYYEGWYGPPPWPAISGSFEVYHSIFRRMASGTPVLNVEDASVVIQHNRYEDLYWAQEACDLVNSSFEFSNNYADTTFGMDLYPFWAEQDIGASILIQNNIFRGQYGILMEQPFGEGVTCLLQGNNVQNVSDIGIYLGPGVYGCTLVGGSNKTNVVDLGYDNILVGVNNMGTGVGPTIQSFMRKMMP